MISSLIVIVLAILGAIFLAFWLLDSVWSVLELISSYLMPYFLPAEVQPLAIKFGPWAVVTGGTDGIGKQYAMELARRGINVAIISRNPDKLRAVAAEIGNKQYAMELARRGINVVIISRNPDKLRAVAAEIGNKQYAMELARHGINVLLISRNPDKLRAVAAEIGNKQYAMELARRGINVLIISRNPDKLRAVAAEIGNKQYAMELARRGINVLLISRSPDKLRAVAAEIVNNVGVQYDYPMPLNEVPPSKSWEIINVNVGAVTAMSRMVLPGMVARGKGALVNVSSGSELQPLPLMTVYAATKAYVESFTKAVREEYSSKGIHVQHLSPLFVSTKMNSFSNKLLEGSFLVPDAALYASHAVNTLGRDQYPVWWTCKIQEQIFRNLPDRTCWNWYICILALAAIVWTIVDYVLPLLDVVYNISYA
ncbi:Steroid dehydrogenase, partial [Operophtera brumata]